MEDNPHLDREEYLAALELMGFGDRLPALRWPCPPEFPQPPSEGTPTP